MHGVFEFHVEDILSDLLDASYFDQNFMWLLARRIFHDEDLVGIFLQEEGTA